MKITLINNKFTQKTKIDLSEDLLRGYGVFETIKGESNAPVYLKEHIDRLYRSAKAIGLKLKYSKSEITEMAQKVAQKGSPQIQCIRITAITDNLIITSEPANIDPEIYQKGIALLPIVCRRALPKIKAISYLPSYLSNQQAKAKKYDDALLIDENDEVYEAAYANLFWFEGKHLCTREKDILPGIIRDKILKRYLSKIKFKNIKLNQLLKKRGIFVTSSVRGIVPVRRIGRTKIAPINPSVLDALNR